MSQKPTTMRIAWVMVLTCAARLNGFPLARLSSNIVSALSQNSRLLMNGSAYDEKEGPGQADIGVTTRDQLEVGNMSWRAMIERSSNRSRKIRGSNYVQLATVDPETNEPRCRTVVFRGFLSLPANHPSAITCNDLPCVAKLITDLNSEKVSQLTKHSNNVAELLWWFPRSSEQYRIRGDVLFVGNGQFEKDDDEALQNARKQMWGNISDAARESFLTDVIPGQDFTVLPTCPPTGGRDNDGKLLPAPNNFLLVLLFPKRVDYLSLSSNYRQIDSLIDGVWTHRRVMP